MVKTLQQQTTNTHTHTYTQWHSVRISKRPLRPPKLSCKLTTLKLKVTQVVERTEES